MPIIDGTLGVRASVWYRLYDVVAGQRFKIDTCDSGVDGLDTVLAVYDEDGHPLAVENVLGY